MFCLWAELFILRDSSSSTQSSTIYFASEAYISTKFFLSNFCQRFWIPELMELWYDFQAIFYQRTQKGTFWLNIFRWQLPRMRHTKQRITCIWKKFDGSLMVWIVFFCDDSSAQKLHLKFYCRNFNFRNYLVWNGLISSLLFITTSKRQYTVR